ncbi:Leucine-rich repeat-containing protein 56 [Takifugu flavidus]|uniref:Leucine-rich repeat-containing protein 56 n=1 Tax=Takifugu flavidus TaxID=433684 RepID=A0A5C6P708_9TELE|nr:Leucine-rich repeat-containing protein 56 [Takifugu flavidus]
MSSCYERVLREVRPLTARAMVAELSGPIQPTPVPVPCDIYESDVELLYLSRKKLEQLCGTEDLSHVTLLQICVDTQENTLGNFGVYLPKLLQLRMTNSVIKSMRDLGTALYHLQVLWMTRCSLRDLSGVSNFSSLKELYLAYNSISELSQVGMLENLQLLDLEGNDVDDLVQVYKKSFNFFSTQTAGYSYRAAVRELVPQLCYLDNLSLEESERHSSSTMGEDWVVLQTAIKDSKFLRAAAVGADSRPTTGSRPSSAIRPGPLPPNGPKPGTIVLRHKIVAETCILAHGAGNTKLCGNPVRALRARREKLRTAPSRSMFSPRDLPIHIPEHTYDIEELDGERDDVLAELRAWREHHSSADMVLSSSAQTRLPTTEIANILASPAVTRPRTARAALQKHHLHRSLQPCRGSPQTNTH